VRDARGKAIETTLPSGRKRVTRYDDRGLVVRSDNDDGTFAAFTYRADGQMIAAENQSAKVVMDRDEIGASSAKRSATARCARAIPPATRARRSAARWGSRSWPNRTPAARSSACSSARAPAWAKPT